MTEPSFHGLKKVLSCERQESQSRRVLTIQDGVSSSFWSLLFLFPCVHLMHLMILSLSWIFCKTLNESTSRVFVFIPLKRKSGVKKWSNCVQVRLKPGLKRVLSQQWVTKHWRQLWTNHSHTIHTIKGGDNADDKQWKQDVSSSHFIRLPVKRKLGFCCHLTKSAFCGAKQERKPRDHEKNTTHSFLSQIDSRRTSMKHWLKWAKHHFFIICKAKWDKGRQGCTCHSKWSSYDQWEKFHFLIGTYFSRSTNKLSQMLSVWVKSPLHSSTHGAKHVCQHPSFTFQKAAASSQWTWLVSCFALILLFLLSSKFYPFPHVQN